MDTVNSPSKIAAITLSGSADDPDQLVGVAAGELFEWGWTCAELADWLDHADATTRADFDRFFGGFRSPEQVAVFLAQVSERIGNLLDAQRGQP